MTILKIIIKSLKNTIQAFFQILYKEKCCICGCSKDDYILCKNCAKTVKLLSGFAHSKFEGVEIYSASFYKDIMKDLILKIKFRHKKDISKVLAGFLSKFYRSIIKNNTNLKYAQNLLVVPIPTNIKNVKSRGYNNVYEIAKCFCENEGLKISNTLLTKIKNNKPQFSLNVKQRKTNIKGCFKADLKNYNSETILIIDDIFTTGATLKEAIKTLKQAGVKNIFCITLSKTV